MEELTKYKIETTDSHEAALMINAMRMASALDDVLGWYSVIHNGKDYDYMICYRGKLYSPTAFEKVEIPPEDRDERGFIKSDLYRHVYTTDSLERKLRELTEDVSDLIYTHYR